MDTRKDTCTINMKSGCLSWCILRDLTALSEEDIRGFPKVESSISCCKLGPKITNVFEEYSGSFCKIHKFDVLVLYASKILCQDIQ